MTASFPGFLLSGYKWPRQHIPKKTAPLEGFMRYFVRTGLALGDFVAS
jgi:hypothetical protein